MIQGTEEWFSARLGKVTASRVADLMAKTKTGPAASRQNYMMELLCQRLTGACEQGFSSAAMQRGTEMEPLARSAYEVITGETAIEVGLVDHQEIVGFAASPDGLVGDCGLMEIKCPNTAQHVKFLQTKKPDSKYIWQMAAQMACTDRAWCDFVSFDDRLPEPLQFASVRIERDLTREAEMLEEIQKFLTELSALEAEMLALATKKAA